jgi:hypothetical protein
MRHLLHPDGRTTVPTATDPKDFPCDIEVLGFNTPIRH